MNPTVDNNKIRAQFITIIEILKGNKEKNSKEFLKIYKKNKEDEILIVFLIKKLNEIQSINIRESQILSLLLLINKSDSKGKIAQIETGQGKTIIILLLASFLALKYNCKVFIATSNSELAKRDAKMNRKFFENCGLEIFPNDEKDDDPNYLSSEIYNKKRIFYGTASTFCGLIIRQKLEEGFEKNFYDSLIIDEIDNLTIDNFSTFTYLCTPINGFELLNPFYILIYCIAHCLKKQILLKDEYYYFIPFSMQYDGKNHIKMINSDLTFPLEQFKMTFEQLEKFIINTIKNIVIDFIVEYNKQGCYFYPPFYEKYINNELDILSRRSFEISFYEYNDNYVISNVKLSNKICPVSKDTGITELNQVYSEAISFFLSLKHKLDLNEECLSPTFLTYASMFKTFASDKQNNLYGVTGTIGEKNDAQRFLKNFYNVDIIISPSFNKNLSIEYPPILVNNEKEWISKKRKGNFNNK